MKQMDTIRNHEWIPTEFDLENMPRVTQQLPTATEKNYGIVYLLDGAQDGYVKSHFYKCEKDADGRYFWNDLHVGRFAVGNCRNIRLRLFDDGSNLRVIMAWEDPDDVIVGSEITAWKKTVLVHQVGHMPLTVNDGTIICTNETRNAYSAFGTFSTTISDTGSRKHYFKLFPYSDDDAVTNDDQNGRCAGYNYAITSDVHPYTLDPDGNPVYRTYYSRTLNQETGLYVYTELAYNETNFTAGTVGGVSVWEFTKAKTYYTYENSVLNWAGIQELVKNGVAEDYFPCGTILMLPYHGDYGEMAFEVVDFDNVEPADSSIKFTMTLQAKYLYSWWDLYGTGYVFDTNEKAGAATKDAARDASKVYFLRQSLNTTVYTASGPAPVKDILAQEGGAWIYLESIWDANRDGSEQGSVDGTTYNVNNLTWSKWSTVGTKYECELPYTTVYAEPKIAANTTGTVIARPIGGNVICSDLRRSTGGGSTADYVLTKDVVYQPNKTYYSDQAGTVKTVVVGDAVTGTVYESASKVIRYNSLYRASGTSSALYYSKSNVSGTNGMYKDMAAAIGGWGAGYRKTATDCYYDGGTLNLNLQAPRGNTYADRFRPVYKVKDNPDTYGTAWSAYLKYFVPAELKLSKHVVDASTSKQTQYVTDIAVYMRDCSDDLRNIYAYIYANVNSALHDACAPYALGTYATGGTWRMNLAKVCGYDGDLEPLLKMPTQDETFVAGKVYWMATWTAASGDAAPGVFYYERLGGGTSETGAASTDTSRDYSDPYIYRRIRCTCGQAVPAGTYVPTWTKLDFRSANSVTVDGVTYSVGEIIPVRAGHGYLVQQLGTTGNPTVSNCVWTMGERNSSGAYIAIGTDLFGRTPAIATTSTYAPSISAGGAGNQYNPAYRTTDFFEGPMQNVNGNDRIWLFNKMPNTERVVYGNHVWCQSNVRSYLNGPFDKSKEYIQTADTAFVTSRSYYRFSSGVYTRLIEVGSNGTEDASHFKPGTNIVAWSNSYNNKNPVYVKTDGGIPVGVKLDMNQPSRYWAYGCLPKMPYRYNSSTSQWEAMYPVGSNWWDPQPSVNNGLVYDKLATMYNHFCVVEGAPGSDTLVTEGTVTNKSGDTGSWLTNVSLDVSTLTTRHLTPRQSFLHGFIDCQYKRTSDQAMAEGKAYFKRTVYGNYEAVTQTGINPYKCGLYEENPNYRTDLQDANDFLNAIVPVINRNGLYGTTGAFDFYPRGGVTGVNLGGTMCVDKVWLMSTNQIVGGESANNGVYEEWSGAANGRWLTFNVDDENRYGLVSTMGHKYGLKKWAMCKASYEVFGGASLNDTRIKYSLTLGQHLTVGYTDSTVAAQYWWLRSAGGSFGNPGFQAPTMPVQGPTGYGPGMGGYTRSTVARNTYLDAQWTGLSPLITIG